MLSLKTPLCYLFKAKNERTQSESLSQPVLSKANMKVHSF